MCRFLLVRSKSAIQPKGILTKFATIAKKSKALDGDWQGDGWGFAWIDTNGQWQVKRSLLPIWEEMGSFSDLPEVRSFAVHARSASFPQHKGNVEFNQPYIMGEFAFVFNGLLKGVSLTPIPGKIGAEKIWYLLQRELKNTPPQISLKRTEKLLIDNSKEIVALNIGLMSSKNMFSLNYFTRNPEYYKLHHYKSQNLKIICSEYIEWG